MCVQQYCLLDILQLNFSRELMAQRAPKNIGILQHLSLVTNMPTTSWWTLF